MTYIIWIEINEKEKAQLPLLFISIVHICFTKNHNKYNLVMILKETA